LKGTAPEERELGDGNFGLRWPLSPLEKGV